MESDELVTIIASNERRLGDLNKKNIQVQGLDIAYLKALVEELLGPERVEKARKAHEQYVSTTLDSIEENVRKAQLLQGGFGFNGKGV